jgi:hypothetical protein
MKRSIQSVFKLGLMVTLTELQIIFKYRGYLLLILKVKGTACFLLLFCTVCRLTFDL